MTELSETRNERRERVVAYRKGVYVRLGDEGKGYETRKPREKEGRTDRQTGSWAGEGG